MDFRISKWISTFWILFEELLFVILKILLINKPSQPGCTQNTMSQALHSSPRRTAYCVHNILAHNLSKAPPSLWAGPGQETTHINICIILCMHDVMHTSPQNDLCPRPKIGRVQRSFDLMLTSYIIRARHYKLISLKYTDIRGGSLDWISGFQSGFMDFKVDFWVSDWISGFQSGFLDFVGFLDYRLDFCRQCTRFYSWRTPRGAASVAVIIASSMMPQ